MLKLCLKLGLFFILLLVIKIPFIFFYESELNYRRKEFKAKNFDTVFVGSSRTMGGILPAYFDHLNQNLTLSYNFGVTAGVSNQTFDRCEEILKTRQSVKNLLVELSGGIESVQVYEEPWTNFDWQEHWRATKRLEWQKALIYNERLIVTFFKPNPSRLHVDNNISLETVLDRNNNPEKPVPVKNISKIRQRNLMIETSDNLEELLLNEIYWNRVLKIIKLADEKGVNLRFYIPPRLETDKELELIYPIWQSLPETNKLRVNHYEDALYTDETSVDEFHLNHTGAIIFTQNVADAFRKHNN